MSNHRLVQSMWPVVIWVPIALLLLFQGVHADQTIEDQARAFVETTINGAVDTLRIHEQEGLTPEKLHQIISDQIQPHFDLDGMSYLVLGKYWKKATKAQQEQFIEQFWKLLVRTYATVLNQYTRETIEVLQPQERNKKRFYVPILVTQSGSKPVEITYKIHLKDDAWKVYDVAVVGVSLVKNYRASFVSVVRRESMDGLIARITTMNQSS